MSAKRSRSWIEHYDEAEALLEQAELAAVGEWSTFFLAKAQVHATLAQLHHTPKREPVTVPVDDASQFVGQERP
jgi:hypothetical protein